MLANFFDLLVVSGNFIMFQGVCATGLPALWGGETSVVRAGYAAGTARSCRQQSTGQDSCWQYDYAGRSWSLSYIAQSFKLINGSLEIFSLKTNRFLVQKSKEKKLRNFNDSPRHFDESGMQGSPIFGTLSMKTKYMYVLTFFMRIGILQN